MAKLVWDEVGKRLYETGVDHGVLYRYNGTGGVGNSVFRGCTVEWPDYCNGESVWRGAIPTLGGQY